MTLSRDCYQVLLVVLRGYGQLVFQPHAGAGGLVLLGIALNSPAMLLAALLGGVCSTLAGYWLVEPQAHRQGLFGFNGALLGLASALLLAPSQNLWLLVACGAVVTSLLFGWALKRGFAVLTAPYIVITVLLFLCLPPRLLSVEALRFDWPLLTGTLMGLGQMSFQGSLLSALCLAAGLVLGTGWRALGWALVGSFAGALAGLLCGVPASALATGLFSYNSALVAVALGCTPGHSHARWQVIAGVIVTLGLTLLAWQVLPLPMLTAPFVLAMWLMMLLQRYLFSR